MDVQLINPLTTASTSLLKSGKMVDPAEILLGSLLPDLDQGVDSIVTQDPPGGSQVPLHQQSAA